MTNVAVFLNDDEIGTIEFALEALISDECCEGHQISAASIYEKLQIANATLEDEVRRNGEA